VYLHNSVTPLSLPQISFGSFITEGVSALLEISMVLCIIILQFYTSSAGTQEAILGLSLALLVTQVRKT
jgi:hypothetical protein